MKVPELVYKRKLLWSVSFSFQERAGWTIWLTAIVPFNCRPKLTATSKPEYGKEISFLNKLRWRNRLHKQALGRQGLPGGFYPWRGGHRHLTGLPLKIPSKFKKEKKRVWSDSFQRRHELSLRPDETPSSLVTIADTLCVLFMAP